MTFKIILTVIHSIALYQALINYNGKNLARTLGGLIGAGVIIYGIWNLI